jgi:mannose-6-phosphate isomerase
LIAGLKPDVSEKILAESIRNGTIIDHVRYVPVTQGDTVFMPAGTMHALGPGLLIYEVQQTSDWTYRVYDWGRPQTETRKLHIEKSIEATRVDYAAPIIPPPAYEDGSKHMLIHCEYFVLEMLSAHTKSIDLDTQGESFHAITVIEGKAILQAGDQQVEVGQFQTVLVPAELGSYQFKPLGNCRALKAST